jgi:hypothetical protein
MPETVVLISPEATTARSKRLTIFISGVTGGVSCAMAGVSLQRKRQSTRAGNRVQNPAGANRRNAFGM